ncbi:hypothetical protein POM88_038872 [Heracleum sosnowskyi]|uniref:protein-disulfide reductase n=1 Tax=Heracleum sosnowskyi TaxID=360622 RepID=A0AAD8HB88_9APIA|nr:hypothetical protein POM88_038872 [Heracleum sosnowskyi]
MCYELELGEKRSFIKIIFISLDRDKTSFEQHFSKMTWLALPFDMRIESLIDFFGVRDTLKLVVIERSGETVITEARDLVYFFGLKAYPFTEERVKKMEEDVPCTPGDNIRFLTSDPFMVKVSANINGRWGMKLVTIGHYLRKRKGISQTDSNPTILVPDFEKCVDHFMMSKFMWSNVLDLSNAHWLAKMTRSMFY